MCPWEMDPFPGAGCAVNFMRTYSASSSGPPVLDAGSEIIDVHLVFVEEMTGCVSGGQGEGSLEAHKSRDSLLLSHR